MPTGELEAFLGLHRGPTFFMKSRGGEVLDFVSSEDELRGKLITPLHNLAEEKLKPLDPLQRSYAGVGLVTSRNLLSKLFDRNFDQPQQLDTTLKFEPLVSGDELEFANLELQVGDSNLLFYVVSLKAKNEQIPARWVGEYSRGREETEYSLLGVARSIRDTVYNKYRLALEVMSTARYATT